jgi:uncharacterized protein YhaN
LFAVGPIRARQATVKPTLVPGLPAKTTYSSSLFTFASKDGSKTQTIKLPKHVVEEIYRTSVRFAEVLETVEVLVDKKTMRRIKLGEQQYRRKQYVAARGAQEIRRVLSD